MLLVSNFSLFNQAQTIEIDLSQKDWQTSLSVLPESFYCESLEIEADVNPNCQPLEYLIDIKNNSCVSKRDIEQAVFYLKYTQKFERLIIEINDKKLLFFLYSYWTLANLCCKGVWVGKEKIRSLYNLDCGAVFMPQEHDRAVARMKEDFIKRGFLDIRIIDTVTRNYENKTVSVVLSMTKGPRFAINHNCVSSPAKLSDIQAEILESIRIYASKQLHNMWYKQHVVDRFQEDVSTYLNRHGYPFAHIEYKVVRDSVRHSVNLEWQVTFNKYLKTMFVGNHFFSQQQLHEHILRGSENLWPISAPVCIHEIEDYYRKKGFWDIQVKCREVNNELIFNIDEGQRYLLGDVQFEGVEKFSSQLLRKLFTSSLKRPYDEEMVSDIVDNLLSVYLEQGFWDIQIIKKKFICGPDKQLCLKLFINEGERRQLKSISIPDWCELESQGPFARFKTVSLPVPFKFSYLKEQRKWLLNHFQQHGFRSIIIKPQLNEFPDGINLEWHVQLSDKKARFGKTVVVGALGVNLEHIYRELCYKQCDVWSKKKLEQTFARLNGLGIYDTVSVHPLAQTDPCGEQPVTIRVIPDEPYEIRTRIGFQNVSKNLIFRERATYKIGGTFIYKDVTGNADQIRLDGDITRFYRIVEASYSVPWTFGFPIKTVIKGYSNKFDQPVYIGSKHTLYRARQNGGLIGWQRKNLDRNVALNLGIEDVKIDQLSMALAEAIDFSFKLTDKWVPYFNLEPTLFIESLNDKLYPSKGFSTLLSCKWMLPLDGKAEYFFKCMIDQAGFYPISRIVFAMRVRAGHIFAKNFSEIVPTERFYLGGQNSIRCYLPDLAPPLGRIRINDCLCCFPQGGATMLNINFELRCPFFRSMSAVIFNDLGVLNKPKSTNEASRSYQTCCKCEMPETWRANILGAVGVGVRYNTPIGPLRFDFGWNINQQCECDSPYAWYLALGHAF